MNCRLTPVQQAEVREVVQQPEAHDGLTERTELAPQPDRAAASLENGTSADAPRQRAPTNTSQPADPRVSRVSSPAAQPLVGTADKGATRGPSSQPEAARSEAQIKQQADRGYIQSDPLSPSCPARSGAGAQTVHSGRQSNQDSGGAAVAMLSTQQRPRTGVAAPGQPSASRVAKAGPPVGPDRPSSAASGNVQPRSEAGISAAASSPAPQTQIREPSRSSLEPIAKAVPIGIGDKGALLSPVKGGVKSREPIQKSPKASPRKPVDGQLQRNAVNFNPLL